MPNALHPPAPAALSRTRRLGGDRSLALLADPYRFIGNHCNDLRADAFETRLLLERTLCMRGAEASVLFYDTRRFMRAGAAPEPIRATLFGKGSVHGLDDEAHLRRKALFTGSLTSGRVGALVRDAQRTWEKALARWAVTRPFSLYRALQPVLTRAVCRWAGVPLPEADTARRSAQLAAMFDYAASGPINHLRARLARIEAEAWLSQLIEEARMGHVHLADDSPAHAATWFQEPDGSLFPPGIAAVELLNLMRPTVAVSVYITFVAHALHRFPEWESFLAQGGTARDALCFVQEVRRYYPFVPAAMARVRESFEWDGLEFPKGRRVLLDLYGTNRDPRVWEDPHVFRPDRWHSASTGRVGFVPQGGGEVGTNHRCPGEDLAVQLMLMSLQMLVRGFRYVVCEQDLRLAMDRVPAIPRHGFVIERVTSSP